MSKLVFRDPKHLDALFVDNRQCINSNQTNHYNRVEVLEKTVASIETSFEISISIELRPNRVNRTKFSQNRLFSVWNIDCRQSF